MVKVVHFVMCIWPQLRKLGKKTLPSFPKKVPTGRYYTLVRMTKSKKTNNTKCWRGGGATGTLQRWRWTCSLAGSLWKIVWIPTKAKYLLVVWPGNSTSRYLPERKECFCAQKDPCMNIPIGFTYSCPKLETIRCSAKGSTVTHPYTGILLSSEQEGTHAETTRMTFLDIILSKGSQTQETVFITFTRKF